ncbi:MAG TPA: DUF4331 domain-containing protein [Verrucomicrobiae bacterium]|nr:DUF4331 domain-containing protein [Verrucomicrobiae bacterium]
MKNIFVAKACALAVTGLALGSYSAHASSHREAPLIAGSPRLDCADFYMFNSYETGRSNFVTIVADYVPLQDAYGGPNYFTLDPNAIYEIHIDNDGDAKEDITFQFKFANTYKGIALPIGPTGNQKTNAIPLINAGQITATNNGALNLAETYTLHVIRGPRRTGAASAVKNAATGAEVFEKPVDYIGKKSLPDYESYANAHIYNINLPGSDTPGRMFVGQRKDPFVVNLGETFDLINISTSPLGPVDANKDSLRYKNITSMILEIPKSYLLSAKGPIIGAWATASKVEGTNYTQVSRLGMPLVNEVVIGITDKDKFNASEPKDDTQFIDYVTHPILPAFIELLYSGAGAKAPAVPRNDLVAVFATGLDGLNNNGSVGEMVRLNTSIPAIPAADQKNLAALAGDVAGFPNGRRPGDDVVDIALRVVMGALVPGSPNEKVPFTDGAYVDAKMFRDTFPYLNLPIQGSPNDPYINILLQSSAQAQGPYSNASGVSYNPASQQLTADKPADGSGFYRLQTDGKAGLSGLKVNSQTVQVGVK